MHRGLAGGHQLFPHPGQGGAVRAAERFLKAAPLRSVPISSNGVTSDRRKAQQVRGQRAKLGRVRQPSTLFSWRQAARNDGG